MKIVRSLALGAMSLFFAFGLMLAPVAYGAATEPVEDLTGAGAVVNGAEAFTGVGSLPGKFKTDPREIAKKIINFVSGFLGIIAVVLVLVAGFMWMTSGGEDKKAEEAKKLLFNAVIGLILILATWSIAYFVVDQLGKLIRGA